MLGADLHLLVYFRGGFAHLNPKLVTLFAHRETLLETLIKAKFNISFAPSPFRVLNLSKIMTPSLGK